MAKFNVKFYWNGGFGSLDEVEAKNIDELTELYQKAINNKKDRSFTVESSSKSTTYNLDKIVAIEVAPTPLKAQPNNNRDLK